jgi:hypothetical protein
MDWDIRSVLITKTKVFKVESLLGYNEFRNKFIDFLEKSNEDWEEIYIKRISTNLYSIKIREVVKKGNPNYLQVRDIVDVTDEPTYPKNVIRDNSYYKRKHQLKLIRLLKSKGIKRKGKIYTGYINNRLVTYYMYRFHHSLIVSK